MDTLAQATLDTSHASETLTREQRLRPVRIWLYAIAALVLVMVVVGGVTRLTDSGLSITSWKPISGTLPPLTAADWQAEFDAYKQIPEYQLQNHWMSLEDFKSIFWWEWGHRFLGRFIGLAFFVPFCVFLFQRRLDRSLIPSLAGLFVLGGFQGALGWWMVSSGLTERVDVSQYRLAAHLGAACLLLGALVWVARTLEPRLIGRASSANWKGAVWLLAALVFVQVIAGAFVAGLDAGFGYNTWPLMEGALVPEGLMALEPGWRNLFESTLTVQFNHRILAYVITLYVAGLLWFGRRKLGFDRPNVWLGVVAVLTAGQVALGIATLLLVVPIPLAAAHQALAFILFGAIIAYAADLKRTVI